MHIECCIPKATDTQSEYVILIAFTLQQWLHERASLLGLHLHCLHSLDPFFGVFQSEVL